MIALAARSETTTSWVGAIGVRPASTTKVTRAESSAKATAARPSARGSHPDAGAVAADTSSAVADWPTVVINSSHPNGNPRNDAPGWATPRVFD